jgi:hypothetical protein
MAVLLTFEKEDQTLMRMGADLKDFQLYIYALKEFLQETAPDSILPHVMETVCHEFDDRFEQIVL